MGRKWKSVKDMIIDIGGEEFYNVFSEDLRKRVNIHPITKKMQNLNHLKIYQSRRFYIDEYEGQEKLREEYFSLKRASYNFTVNNNETYWFDSRFLTRK
jgi:hypothetical protein